MNQSRSSNLSVASRLYGMPIQTSLLGKPIPLLYGQNRIAAQIIWYGDWVTRKIDTGGGGKFGKIGGKGGTGNFAYSAAVMLGLCHGPIKGIRTVWLDRTRLGVGVLSESITVASTAPVPPSQTSGYAGNIGSKRLMPYLENPNDPGSPGVTTLSGTNGVPMTQVNGTPSAGEYKLVSTVGSIWLTDNGSNYNPNSPPTVTVDAPFFGGVTATAHVVRQTDEEAFASDKIWSIAIDNPGSGYDPLHPPSVNIGAPGGGGTQAAAVANLVDSYVFSSADIGKTVEIFYRFYVLSINDVFGANIPVQNLGMVLFAGATGQNPWDYMTSRHPNQALGYSGLAHLDNGNMDLGGSGMVSNYNFEVAGLLQNLGGDIIDAHPANILFDFCTNSQYGAGLLPTEIGDLTEITNYCYAQGLFISPIVDEQRPARDYIAEWLKVANCEAVWSDGKLKVRSYGDKTIVGMGVTFTPSTQPVYDLDDDAYIISGGDNPVRVERPSVRDAENLITVEWANRGNNYSLEPLYESDDAHIRIYDAKPRPVDSLHCITSGAVAQKVASTMLQRSVYVRNKYNFSLDAIKYMLVEPMDILTSTDFGLGMARKPVRLLTVEEGDDLRINCTAEEFPWSAASPTQSPKQTLVAGDPSFALPPGPVSAPMFLLLPSEVTGLTEYVLGIALSGGPNWGGCDIYVSTDDGNSYQLLGRRVGAATVGLTTASLAGHTDPDDANTLSVNLTQSFGSLNASYTTAEENNFVSLIAVGSELLSYRTATNTATFNYDLTHLRRGVYASTVSLHGIGSQFCLVDTGLFQWFYDASVIGTTVKFKFASFNKSGQQSESIESVTVYSYTLHAPVPVTVTNQDLVIIKPGDYVINAVATTVDVHITLPNEEFSQGHTVTVISDNGNTHAVIVQPDTAPFDDPPDTINGSGSSVTIPTGDIVSFLGV